MPRLLSFLIALCLLSTAALAESYPGVTSVISSTVTGKPDRELGIFFVGNVYTYENGMPKMLADIASSDAGNHIQFDIQSATRQSATLDSLWHDDQVQSAFAARPWNYVVLQEQSLWATLPESVEATALAVRKWYKTISATEAQPVIFVSWPRQPNSFWYTDRKYSFLESPGIMLQKIDANSDALATSIRGLTAPVGDAWMAALKDDIRWPLYGPDSHHPSLSGSYLTALVFYQLFSGRSAEDTTFVPQGIDADAAKRLRKYAASVRKK